MVAAVTAQGTLALSGLASSYGVALATNTAPPATPAPTQQIKFAWGDYALSQGNYFGTPLVPGAGYYQDEINTPGVSAVAGYAACFVWPTLEDTSLNVNGALSVQGLTGAALQAAIIKQFPGFPKVEAVANYLWSKAGPNANFVMYTKMWAAHANTYTNSVVQQDWKSTTFFFPNWMIRSPTITIPDYYGGPTTKYVNAPVAPIYAGATNYGFGFTAYNGGTLTSTPQGAYGALIPHLWNPAICQAISQVMQAFALYKFQSGPYAGLTFDQIRVFSMCFNNDEVSINMDGATGVGRNIPGGIAVNPPVQGATAYPATPANFYAGYRKWFTDWTNASPHTIQAGNNTFGFGAIGYDTTTTLPSYANNNIPPNNALTNIRGFALSAADLKANAFGQYGAATPQASDTQEGFIGITPSGQKPLPAATYPSEAGHAPYVANFEGSDYEDGLGTTGIPTNSPAAVVAMGVAAANLNANWRMWQMGDNVFFGTNAWTGAKSGSNPNSGSTGPANWNGQGVYATLQTMPAANSLLPTRMMYGPSIINLSATSSSVTIGWTPILNQGTFNSASAAGIKLNVLRDGNPTPFAQVDASLGTFTDSPLAAGVSHTYALQMVNSNGTGPQGPSAQLLSAPQNLQVINQGGPNASQESSIAAGNTNITLPPGFGTATPGTGAPTSGNQGSTLGLGISANYQGLSWQPPTTGVATKYNIYRNGTLYDSVATPITFQGYIAPTTFTVPGTVTNMAVGLLTIVPGSITGTTSQNGITDGKILGGLYLNCSASNFVAGTQIYTYFSAATGGGGAGQYLVNYSQTVGSAASPVTFTGWSYNDTQAINCVPFNCGASPPATIYAYKVTAVDSGNNEGPAAFPSVYLYRGISNTGFAQFSFGGTTTWNDTTGAPQNGPYDIRIDESGGGYGFQPVWSGAFGDGNSHSYMNPACHFEAGAFKYLVFDIKPNDSSYNGGVGPNLVPLMRTMGNFGGIDSLAQKSINISPYCTPPLAAGVWSHCKIPFTALNFGTATAQATFTGVGKYQGKLAVTGLSNMTFAYIGGAVYITGPGIPANSYTCGGTNGGQGGWTDPQGPYTFPNTYTFNIYGPNIVGTENTGPITVQMQAFSAYKMNWTPGVTLAAGQGTIFLNNIGFSTT